MTTRKTLVRLALIVFAVATVSVPIFAVTSSRSFSLTCSGVDSHGSLSAPLGTSCSVKCYKDSSTGIITYTASTTVWNKSGPAYTFSNQGYPIIDPVTRANLVCTSDVQTVSKCSRWLAKLGCWDRVSCKLVGCHDPSGGSSSGSSGASGSSSGGASSSSGASGSSSGGASGSSGT